MKENGFFFLSIDVAVLRRETRSYFVSCRKLCEAPYNKTVDWTKWYVFWADERAVAKNHVDSNFKLTRDAFLSRVCGVSRLLFAG